MASLFKLAYDTIIDRYTCVHIFNIFISDCSCYAMWLRFMIWLACNIPNVISWLFRFSGRCLLLLTTCYPLHLICFCVFLLLLCCFVCYLVLLLWFVFLLFIFVRVFCFCFGFCSWLFCFLMFVVLFFGLQLTCRLGFSQPFGLSLGGRFCSPFFPSLPLFLCVYVYDACVISRMCVSFRYVCVWGVCVCVCVRARGRDLFSHLFSLPVYFSLCVCMCVRVCVWCYMTCVCNVCVCSRLDVCDVWSFSVCEYVCDPSFSLSVVVCCSVCDVSLN